MTAIQTHSITPQPDLMRRVAILGTGKMGAAIAGRFAAEGAVLSLWNRTRARAEVLGLGQVAETPATAVAHTDIVISCLTGPDAVRAAYLGPDGALSAGHGRLFIEMSTAGADVVAELGAAATAAGARLVDAPIMGAPTVVRDGKAAILLGGADPDVDVARSVLQELGTVRHVGPLGSGARLKLVANSMLADVVAAAAELQVAGERSGLAPEDVFWALERLAPVLGSRRQGYLMGRHDPALFALRDLRKDLDFAAELFSRAGAPVPLTSVSRDLVAAGAAGTPDLDITALALPYRTAAPEALDQTWGRERRGAEATRNG